MFDDQPRSPSEWAFQNIQAGVLRDDIERPPPDRMSFYRLARSVLDLMFLVCCSLLPMHVLFAQEHSAPYVATRPPEGNAVVQREEFSWPRKTEQDALVVFLGDSITHQGLYTQYLENFFYTRYPDLGLRFRNAGVAGDSVADALARFDLDVASHHPDYVTVLFGMNDGRYEDFDAVIFAEYQANMKRLLDRIESVGAKPIVLSPTMFDHEVTRLRQDDPTWRFREKRFSNSYNALMSLFGAWLWDESRRRGNEFVNLWAPLNSYTDLGRRQDPHFTLIGDAIHPQASGQVVMACEILMQLGVERRFCASRVVSNASRVVSNGSRVTSDKGTANRVAKWTAGKGIRDLAVIDHGQRIKFKHEEVALPWVIPPQHSTVPLRWNLPSDGHQGFAMTHAGHRLSADRIKISGLPAGQYELRVDGKLIGNWSHVMLGTEVELQDLQQTPQYQQSLAVAELNRRRYDEFVRPLRDRMASLKGIRRRFANDNEEYSRRSAPILEAIRDLQAGADQMDRKIRQLARPQCRQWDIRRVDSTTK
ncbi:MAG TPA: hypothetical protein DEF45_06545 [Rhodopirellula sp.]|nr:MAG: hypothetical protein CBD74_14055 [Saprospirales bacterium TMED214]HBV62665.1 hypothetical protein [Rhodopirellula sp.]